MRHRRRRGSGRRGNRRILHGLSRWAAVALRVVVALVCLAVLPGILRVFGVLSPVTLPQSSWFWPLCVGAVAGATVERWLERKFPAVSVFEHELTHVIAGLLFLRVPVGFAASRGGGAVRQVGVAPLFGRTLIADFIGLAPYVLPTFTAILILVRPLLELVWFPWYDGLVGVTFGYHTTSTLREVRQAWTMRMFRSALGGEKTHTDLGEVGLVYSAVYIPVVTLAIHSVLLSILVDGYPGAVSWARVVWSTTVGWFQQIPLALGSF